MKWLFNTRCIVHFAWKCFYPNQKWTVISYIPFKNSSIFQGPLIWLFSGFLNVKNSIFYKVLNLNTICLNQKDQLLPKLLIFSVNCKALPHRNIRSYISASLPIFIYHKVLTHFLDKVVLIASHSFVKWAESWSPGGQTCSGSSELHDGGPFCTPDTYQHHSGGLFIYNKQVGWDSFARPEKLIKIKH